MIGALLLKKVHTEGRDINIEQKVAEFTLSGSVLIDLSTWRGRLGARGSETHRLQPDSPAEEWSLFCY